MNSYLGENDLHESLQSAYKIFHSTETALLTVTNDIMLSLDKGENVFLVLLDLSAAFDTVNHSLLLVRLQKSFGIRGTVLQWFDSYLSQRTQFVTSMRRILRYEIFSWVFSKVQFWDLYSTFCILAEVIRSYGLDYHLYADDTQLYFAFKSVDVDAAKSRVENYILQYVAGWTSTN